MGDFLVSFSFLTSLLHGHGLMIMSGIRDKEVYTRRQRNQHADGARTLTTLEKKEKERCSFEQFVVANFEICFEGSAIVPCGGSDMFGTCIQQLQDFEFVNVGGKQTALLPPRESTADHNDNKESMIMEKAYKQQICSKLYFNIATFLLLIILVLVLLSFFFFFPISKSFPFLLAIPIALLSTIFLVTMTKKKGSQDENLVKDKLQEEKLPQPSLDVTQTEVNNQQSDTENAENHEQLAEAHSDYSFPSDSESSNFSIMDNRTFELNVQEHKLQDDLLSESSLPSDSESSTGSIIGESFEIDQIGNQNVDGSDSLSFDDDDDNDDNEEEEEEEDSLIEINLPSIHFSDPKQKLQSKLPDFLPDSIFKQQGLMELLAEINEMNEDENLIEIDISMGSTNSPDFRLKQELQYFGDECVLSDCD
ncbi:hypothetical protein VNO77_43146 [Canavalia gladiata]|uniref:Transmembrane protein n=1 Tax=Canavalia gladiata TaxID=3824 RepID=A0AAN9JX75_CANGL